MFLARYIGGIIALAKDALRLTFFLLKHPHYVAVLLAAVIGLFYLNGISPHEISVFLESKWQAVVENRRQTFKEDMQLISKRFGNQNGAAVNTSVKNIEEVANTINAADIEDPFKLTDNPVIRREELVKHPQFENSEQQMKEEVFGWQQAFREAQKPIEISDENVVEGVLSVVNAGKVRIKEKTFSLKVRLRSGKAGEAYHRVKHHFDGKTAKCVPDKNDPEKAECFVGALGVSEMLIDFGLADPI
ncbi:MAG: hypothetical protein IJ846_03325 [Alphaproteobacteria bacterium]|nr:hypothetical protein [Alphaproteobacteria bacterium]